MTTAILSHLDVTWTNIVHPTAEDLSALASRFPNFHPLNLKDCQTELEYPKLDHHDHYLFLVVQMPYMDYEDGQLRPAEVDIFISHGNLVTAHRGELSSLQTTYAGLQENTSMRDEWLGRGASPLLYHLIDLFVEDCFPLVRALGQQLRHIEDHLFQNNTRHLLREIAALRRDIIVLRSILKSQNSIIHSLIQGNWTFIQETLDPYWGDISDHLNQLCALADQYSEVIDGLADTIDTLASHRIDDVVRLLTVTTILSLPVTLLATIFGMNIAMPFSKEPLLFYSIVTLGVIFTMWMIWFLKSRKWL